jgi:type II secretory pathway component GspD/PulD (secretin)
VYAENDDRIGVDFQSWKNNEGTDFFSVGGRYRNNWAAIYGGAGNLNRVYGSERSSFYNFNPRWNTRYLDFLTAKGKAEIVHTGTLTVRNNTGGKFSRTTQIFFSDTSQPANGTIQTPEMGVGPYELLSAIVGEVLNRDLPVGKGNQQIVTRSNAGYGFTLNVKNVSVNLDETSFDITATNTSLIGFESNGAPRIAKGSSVTQTISLPHGKNSFIIGGLRKQETVKSRTGIPWLCEIPVLEYIFGTVSTSTRYADLVIVGECEWASPAEAKAHAITKKLSKGTPAQ